VMLADAFPELGFPAPSGVPSVATVVYVADVDAFAARAVAAGAKLEQPAHDEFFGSRVAALLDPFNHRWLVHTRRELVTVEQMRARMTP
jgi:PhnB protein